MFLDRETILVKEALLLLIISQKLLSTFNMIQQKSSAVYKAILNIQQGKRLP